MAIPRTEPQMEQEMNRTLAILALLVVAIALPAHAQMGGGISLQPYVGYGFFGSLPGNGPKLEAAPSFGGRAAYQVSDQFALFGNYQRSQPKTGLTSSKINVDHWSAGAEFSYVPRGGAQGMLPILLEAGVGQVRYDWKGFTRANESDLAVNLGLGSALQLTPNFGIRYGVNDYLSNYNTQGVTNQIFVQVGAELKL
jgi:hypothetical protein